MGRLSTLACAMLVGTIFLQGRSVAGSILSQGEGFKGKPSESQALLLAHTPRLTVGWLSFARRDADPASHSLDDCEGGQRAGLVASGLPRCLHEGSY